MNNRNITEDDRERWADTYHMSVDCFINGGVKIVFWVEGLASPKQFSFGRTIDDAIDNAILGNFK